MKVCVHLFTSILLTLLSFGPHRSQSVQTRTADFRKTDKRKVNFHNHEGGGGSPAFGDSEETTFLPFSAQKQTFISRSAPVTHPGWWCAVCSAVSEELLTSGKDLNVFGSWGWELGWGWRLESWCGCSRGVDIVLCQGCQQHQQKQARQTSHDCVVETARSEARRQESGTENSIA